MRSRSAEQIQNWLFWPSGAELRGNEEHPKARRDKLRGIWHSVPHGSGTVRIPGTARANGCSGTADDTISKR